MPNYNFKQSFWRVMVGDHGDIGEKQRVGIAAAAEALQAKDQDVVLALSAGGYEVEYPPEIALVLPVEYKAATLTSSVEKALSAAGVSVTATLQTTVRYYEFGSAELLNIKEATKSLDKPANLAEAPPALISETMDVSESIAGEMPAAPAPAPETYFAEGFSMTVEVLKRLKVARGDAVEQELRALSKAFDSLQNEQSITAAATKIVASGLVTVGTDMATTYPTAPRATSVLLLVAFLIHNVAQVAKMNKASQGLAGLFKLADGVNIVLLANSLEPKSQITCTDYAKHGERKASVDQLATASSVVFCGFYCYQKAVEKSQDAGAPDLGFSSGIRFEAASTASFNGGRFSVGMSCPYTDVGVNSICVTKDSADSAADKAAKEECSWQILEVGDVKVTVSRAGKYGMVNYGICFAEHK